MDAIRLFGGPLWLSSGTHFAGADGFHLDDSHQSTAQFQEDVLSQECECVVSAKDPAEWVSFNPVEQPESSWSEIMTQKYEQAESKKVEPQVRKLTELVDYQEGSVVSRTIVDKKTGGVTLFAFDEVQGLSEHTAPFDALVNVVDGQAGITISGASYQVKAGEMILMPAGVPHALWATSRFKMMLTMIRS